MKHLCRIFALGWFSIFMMSTLPTLAQEQTNLTTDSQQALATLPSAQTSLIGTLLEQGTNKPIVGASITLVNQNIVTGTNEEGNF